MYTLETRLDMMTEQTHEWGDDRAGSCPMCHRDPCECDDCPRCGAPQDGPMCSCYDGHDWHPCDEDEAAVTIAQLAGLAPVSEAHRAAMAVVFGPSGTP